MQDGQTDHVVNNPIHIDVVLWVQFPFPDPHLKLFQIARVLPANAHKTEFSISREGQNK